MIIEEFAAGKEEWRVGPEHVRPVPFPNLSSDEYREESMEVFSKSKEEIRKMVERFGIGHTSMELRQV